MANFTVIQGGGKFDVGIIMDTLAVANDDIAIFQVHARVDLVHHVRHVDRITGIRIDTLCGVVAENTQSNFLPGSTVDRQWIMATVAGGSCHLVTWNSNTCAGRNKMIQFIGDVAVKIELQQVTPSIYAQRMGGVRVIVCRQYRAEFIHVSAGESAQIGIGSAGVGSSLDS